MSATSWWVILSMSNWPYNTRQWRRLRKMVLERDVFCVYCREMGRVTPATVADHIIPVKERPDLAFDFNLIQGLCAACHDSIKRREEARGYRVGCSQDGAPVDPGHHWWDE